MECFESREGQEIRKSTIVVRTAEAYPQTLAVQLFGDLTLWSGRVNAVVEVAYMAQSREHDGRWYTDLRGVQVRTAIVEVGSINSPIIQKSNGNLYRTDLEK